MRGLQGKVAIVTGGTGLIGGATCLRLAEEGVTVAVTSRNLEKATEWCRAQSRPGLHPFELNVADADSIRECFDAVKAKCGRPTILIACAIPLEALPVPFDTVTHKDFSRVLEVDVAGNFLCARTMVDRLPEGRTPTWCGSRPSTAARASSTASTPKA